MSVSVGRLERRTDLEALITSIRRVRFVLERGDVELPDGFVHDHQRAVVPCPKALPAASAPCAKTENGGEKTAPRPLKDRNIAALPQEPFRRLSA